MNRKEFFEASAKAGLGCCALALLGSAGEATAADAPAVDSEKQFVKNWMEDLFAALDTELDEATKVKVMAGCGVGASSRRVSSALQSRSG